MASFRSGAERCVSNLLRDALFRRVKGAHRRFDMMQEYFYFVFVAHL